MNWISTIFVALALLAAMITSVDAWRDVKQGVLIAAHMSQGVSVYEAWCVVHQPKDYFDCVERALTNHKKGTSL